MSPAPPLRAMQADITQLAVDAIVNTADLAVYRRLLER